VYKKWAKTHAKTILAKQMVALNKDDIKAYLKAI
jgi:hypothetical protein